MRKWFILLALCAHSFNFSIPIQDRKLDPIALVSLFSALGLPADEDLATALQRHWLRKPGQERWDLKELPYDQKFFVLNWARQQGMFDEWTPSIRIYDKALILGATTSSMQKRLNYLVHLWEEGVRFSEVVWLTGDRPLNKNVDSLFERCHTESEAAHILWEETKLPNDMHHLPVVFIASPMKKEGLLLERPHTADTLISWLNTHPDPCKTLFISHQPFCGAQFAAIKTTLPDAIVFDLAGPGTDLSKNPRASSITLDSIACWIYQEYKSATMN